MQQLNQGNYLTSAFSLWELEQLLIKKSVEIRLASLGRAPPNFCINDHTKRLEYLIEAFILKLNGTAADIRLAQEAILYKVEDIIIAAVHF
jgi:hypothetical protein